MKKAPRGRPKKAAADKREALIRIRVTNEEKAILSAAAERTGQEVSAWLRGLGLERARGLDDRGSKA